MTRTRNAWISYLATRVVAFVADSAAFAFAYAAAFALRFDLQEPIFGWTPVAWSFLTVWAVQAIAFAVTGCAWRAWRRTGILDLPRFVVAFALSAVTLTLMRYFLPSEVLLHIRPPYTITLINTVLAFVACVGLRLLWGRYARVRRAENLLLNRGERLPDAQEVKALVHGKTVMVTGAGGSIGSELVRQVVWAAPAKVILVERAETALYEIDREMHEADAGGICVPAMVDVGDADRMRRLLAEHQPDIILHAAAYKHVPMVESHPVEGVRNNALATRQLGELALAAGVGRFVMISTDKAVRPSSVMGATKRMAEILLMDLNGKGPTLFSAVLGITMALRGFGVWALVWQQLSNVTVNTVILWFTVGWRPKRMFSLTRLKGLLSYGWKLLGAQLLDTVYLKLYPLIIGIRYTDADLAFFDRGNPLPNLVVENINYSIDSVLLPVLSAEQDHREQVREMTRRAIKVSSFVMMPLMAGLAVCAEPLIRLLLKEKWMPCVPFLQIFCAVYAFYPLHTANLNAIKAMGRSDVFLKLEIVKKVVETSVLLLTMRIGILAMALGQLGCELLSLFINAWPNRRLLDYSYRQQLRDMLPSALLSLGMAALLRPLLLIGLSDALTLLLQIPLGVAIYVLGAKLFQLDSFAFILGIAKKMLHRS